MAKANKTNLGSPSSAHKGKSKAKVPRASSTLRARARTGATRTRASSSTDETPELFGEAQQPTLSGIAEQSSSEEEEVHATDIGTGDQWRNILDESSLIQYEGGVEFPEEAQSMANLVRLADRIANAVDSGKAISTEKKRRFYASGHRDVEMATLQTLTAEQRKAYKAYAGGLRPPPIDVMNDQESFADFGMSEARGRELLPIVREIYADSSLTLDNFVYIWKHHAFMIPLCTAKLTVLRAQAHGSSQLQGLSPNDFAEYQECSRIHRQLACAVQQAQEQRNKQIRRIGVATDGLSRRLAALGDGKVGAGSKRRARAHTRPTFGGKLPPIDFSSAGLSRLSRR